MKRANDKRLTFSGDLQGEVMAAIWKLGEAKVEDVRVLQPSRRRSGYTTIQTVLNRLVDRGLLTRSRTGHAFTYSACFSEAEYLSQTIGDRLAEASPEARRKALFNLVGDLDASDLDEITRYAARVRRKRGRDA